MADAAPPQYHGAALATLTLANNLIGLAPGAAVTGLLADRIGLPARTGAGALRRVWAAATCFCVSPPGDQVSDPQPNSMAIEPGGNSNASTQVVDSGVRPSRRS